MCFRNPASSTFLNSAAGQCVTLAVPDKRKVIAGVSVVYTNGVAISFLAFDSADSDVFRCPHL
jgi:hypothetical protein